MSEEDVIRNVILAVQPNKRFVEPEEIGEYLSALAQGFNLDCPVWLSSADGAEPVDLGTLPDKTPRTMRVNELQEMTAAGSEGAQYHPSGDPAPKVVWVG